MPTSGITTFTLTARDAVTKALREIFLELGEDPESEEMEDGIFALNTILKNGQTRGLSLWAETTGTLTMVGGQSNGVIPAYIRDIISASFVSSGVARSLTKIGRGEYFNMPVKAQVGTPLLYYIARQRDAATMYVWPVPAANTSLTIFYERRLDTITNAAETIDFPEEYTGALIANLAVQLSSKYGVSPTQELQLRAARLEMAMFDDDRPESYQIGAWEYS